MAYIPLSGEEREEIRVGITHGDSLSEVARGIGRSASTICREVKRNGGRRRYVATRAQERAEKNRARPKLTVFVSTATRKSLDMATRNVPRAATISVARAAISM